MLFFDSVARVLTVSTRFLRVVGVLILGLGLILSTSTLPVQANETANSGTLTECNFSAATANAEANDSAFENCLAQIFQFIVVLAIILILFRIALSAIKAYNPLDGGGSPTSEAITIVWDIVLGLLFIGGPYLILTTLNPALTNFDITDLGLIFDNVEESQNILQDQNGGSGNDGDSTGDGNSDNNGGGNDAGQEITIGRNTGADVDQAAATLVAAGSPDQGEDTSIISPEAEQEAVERLQEEVLTYQLCHYTLLDAARQAQCVDWQNASPERRAQALEAREVLLNSDSEYITDFNPDVDNQAFTLGEGPYYVQTAVTIREDPNLEVNEITGAGASIAYLRIEPIDNVEDSDMPRLDTFLSEQVFQTTLISSNVNFEEDPNAYYAYNREAGEWSFKGGNGPLTFREGTALEDLRQYDSRN